MIREPITIIEIDMPKCSNVFGTAPCTAALSSSVARKCYNTRATCKDPTNYIAGTQTLRFAKNQSGLPKGQTIFPALQSVSTNAQEINLSGIDPRTNALGKRARVTVSLLDFAYHDTLTDPYQSERISGSAQFDGIGFDPASRGTFFGRLIARQPYYVGMPLRVLRGYVGDALAAMESASYVISEWSGPDAGGNVQITAKDILDLADNKKAVAPAASRGKLDAAITISATTATLKPAGVGVEYATSGRVRIGREIAKFTRSGDVLTFTARGVDGSTASAHAVNDVVQQCLRYENQRICDVISDLLQTYAAIPSGYIDNTAWQAEEDAWLAGMTTTATICDATGVAKLVGELCQLGVMVWWDEVAQEVRYRVNRPLAPGETMYPVTDAANIIRGTPTVDRADDQRISALFFYHGVIDPTNTGNSAYSKLVIATVDDNLYGQEAVKEIRTRWFGQIGDDVNASIIAERLLGRYRDTPKVLGMTLDIKDRASIDLAGLLSVTSYLMQDDDGQMTNEPMQIRKVEILNDQIRIEAETFPISGRFGFWMQDPQADYSTATDEEKATGAFWMDDTIGVFSDGTGPYLYF